MPIDHRVEALGLGGARDLGARRKFLAPTRRAAGNLPFFLYRGDRRGGVHGAGESAVAVHELEVRIAQPDRHVDKVQHPPEFLALGDERGDRAGKSPYLPDPLADIVKPHHIGEGLAPGPAGALAHGLEGALAVKACQRQTELFAAVPQPPDRVLEPSRVIGGKPGHHVRQSPDLADFRAQHRRQGRADDLGAARHAPGTEPRRRAGDQRLGPLGAAGGVFGLGNKDIEAAAVIVRGKRRADQAGKQRPGRGAEYGDLGARRGLGRHRPKGAKHGGPRS